MSESRNETSACPRVERGDRIYLSPPDVGADERGALLDAFESRWIAPVGPHIEAFEAELAAKAGVSHAVALSSGTAALHLALAVAGVVPGDNVLVPTMTFAATANAAIYVGARPCLVDSEPTSWNIDPELLGEELFRRAAAGRLPKAVITVDLYGQCADYDRIEAVCAEYDVPLLEDAAEALGATYRDRLAGSFGVAGVLSFNGNKIITTSGGGALVTNDGDLAARVRYLATQAREPVIHYEHHEVGYNYRLSNLLAALGIAQLRRLDEFVQRRRAVNKAYRKSLADVPGVELLPEVYGRPNCWLTVITIDPGVTGTDRELVRLALEGHNIESRPAWKPLHLQRAYEQCPVVGGAVAERIFERGLCLPSGSGMTPEDQQRVIDVLLEALHANQ